MHYEFDADREGNKETACCIFSFIVLVNVGSIFPPSFVNAVYRAIYKEEKQC